jgi:hypothetical protein
LQREKRGAGSVLLVKRGGRLGTLKAGDYRLTGQKPEQRAKVALVKAQKYPWTWGWDKRVLGGEQTQNPAGRVQHLSLTWN